MKKKGESKGYTDGLHSPFGKIGKIMIERGLTRRQVLWGDSWINFFMEGADQPKWRKGKKPEKAMSLSDAKKKWQ